MLLKTATDAATPVKHTIGPDVGDRQGITVAMTVVANAANGVAALPPPIRLATQRIRSYPREKPAD